MKHLIIHGDSQSGKSLFIRTLISQLHSYNINGENPKNVFNTFQWGMNEVECKRTQILYFQDVHENIDVKEFFNYCDRIIIETATKEATIISPILILEYSKVSENLENNYGASFTRRFNVINTNTATYKEMMQFLINWNKEFQDGAIRYDGISI